MMAYNSDSKVCAFHTAGDPNTNLLKTCMDCDYTQASATRTVCAHTADMSECQKNAIVSTGTLPRLVALLRSPEPQTQEAVAEAVWTLAIGCEHGRDAIITAGALPGLLSLLCPHHYAQRPATGALYALAGVMQPCRTVMLAVDAAPLLAAILKSDKAKVQESAAKAIWSFAAGNQQRKDAIIAADVLPVLIALLQSAHVRVQRAAVRVLRNLASGSQQTKDAIIAADALPLLSALSASGHSDVQKHTVGAIRNLASGLRRSQSSINAAAAAARATRVLSRRSEHWSISTCCPATAQTSGCL